jgi:hypothetical protein
MKLCGSDKQYTDEPRWFDPLGPNAQGQNAPTGGPEARSKIFDYLGSYGPQMAQDANNTRAALTGAASDPGYQMAADNAYKTIRGDYLGGTPTFQNYLNNYLTETGKQTGYTQNVLNGQYLNSPSFGNRVTDATMSGAYTAQGLPQNATRQGDVTRDTLAGRYLNSTPELNYNLDPMLAGVRRRGNAEAADTASNIRSAYGRAGMGFSTANQQAEQANQAAASARSDETEANARTEAQIAKEQAKQQAYLAERGYQNQAGQQEEAGHQQERNLAAQNYMQERGYQNQAGQAAQGLKAQNYLAERGYQQNTGANEQAARRNAQQFSTESELGNYNTERNAQRTGASQLEAAYAPVLNYLSQIPNQQLGPTSQLASIIQGLSGGGPIATPNSTIVRQPGVYDYLLSTIGAVSGAASSW